MARASGSAEDAAFARTLSALKERGSNLLVVGTSYERGHEAVCDRLLGESEAGRHRLHVVTDRCCGTMAGGDRATTRVVEQRTPAAPAWGEDDDYERRYVEVGAVDELERAAVNGFGALAADADEPDPGDLRLCVDSLRPLLVEHSDQRVRRFVGRLAERVAAADGMGHFHLPTRSTDRYVSLLTPVVDAVVEVRARNDQVEQRWHVFDGAVDSGWIAL